ncbi:hypothetical protein CCR75_006658 [Bremia lactucae]|uniref:AB hydrolase-1 domain-containing protein n=1 Tax=Bremia lactucae TaxID=4779 RepID=A0A976FL01_BRELC|nr:hypothetical protein CCR75_006658 [Bremia lactucae]
MSFKPKIVLSPGIRFQRQVEALYAAPKYFGNGVAKEARISTGITVSYAILELPPMNASVGMEQVVLIAGFMQPKDTWAHFIDALLPKWNQKQRGVGLSILVMDNRGFGGTDAPFGMYSTRTMAEDILALMDHIGWRSAHIVGGSMGGMIAQELALLDLRRVCSLILVSTSRDRYKASGRSLGLMVRKTTLFASVSDKANSMVDTLFPHEYINTTTIAETGESVRSAIARMYELQLKRWPEPSLSGVIGQTTAVQTHFVSDERLRDLNNASFPILIVSAMRDDVIPPTESIILKEHLSGDHVHTLFFDAGGHGAICQYADEIADEVVETMRRASPNHHSTSSKMNDSDFVADSDEEVIDALPFTEERFARGNDAIHSADRMWQVTECLAEPRKQELEQNRAMPAVLQTKVQEQDADGVDAAEQQNKDNVELSEECKFNEKTDDEELPRGLLKVGTLVDVESRTWPGINKQGGAGRITRVYREKSCEGESEEFFYDVRYVLGGFERKVERVYVHSSKLLKKHSNRERVSREYYHNDYINRPHLRKQREAQERREKRILHIPQRNKKRRLRDVMQAADEKLNEASSSILAERARGESSQSTNFSGNYPDDVSSRLVEQPAVSQRRRHRIIDSSDEESSRSGDASDQSSHEVEEVETENYHDMNDNSTENSESDSRTEGSEQPWRLERQHARTNRRQFVGGYEHTTNDLDGNFIQPEGNPEELPKDVIRCTGLRLEKTTDGLMKQLQDIFAQQQKHIATFHEEQKQVDQMLANLPAISLSGLNDLYRKVATLDNVFLTKILVNAGEDAMDTIARTLDRRENLPSAFDQLDREIGDWKDELKECSQWIHNIRGIVEDAFTLRKAPIPRGQLEQTESSCDSSYSSDNDDAYHNINEADKAYKVDVGESNTPKQKRHHDFVLKNDVRRPSLAKARNHTHRSKHMIDSTLDGYLSQNQSSDGFQLNFRLAGRQRISFSDPRWPWVELARKKHQRSKESIQDRSTDLLRRGVIDEHKTSRTVRDIHSASLVARKKSSFVQDQRMFLRNKRHRGMHQQQRPHETFVAQIPSSKRRHYSQIPYAARSFFDGVVSEPQVRKMCTSSCTNQTSDSGPEIVDWKAIFDVVMYDSSLLADETGDTDISRKKEDVYCRFGYQISDSLAPLNSIHDEEFGFDDYESFEAVAARQFSRVRQSVNDLRICESAFMDSLSKGSTSAVNEEEYADTNEWIQLVSLGEAYHKAIASLAIQILQALKGITLLDLPKFLKITWKEMAALIRQLPDCDSLFNGCKAYFFFFEVAARDAITTPLLTAVSRTFWYCLHMLEALRSLSDRLSETHDMVKQEIENVYRTILPINRLILAVVLFLFDLYIFLPSSHRVITIGFDKSPPDSFPALALWILIRNCSLSLACVKKSNETALSLKEKHVWALLQTVYRQRYFDKLACCFIRGESYGGYVRDFESKEQNNGKSGICDETFRSKLLALEATWDLLAILSWIYSEPDAERHEEAVCDAKWAVVKDLLYPNKLLFLPFEAPLNQSINLQLEYCQCVDRYIQHVLKRITTFSKRWHPSTDVVEQILRQLCGTHALHFPHIIIFELPRLLKQYISQCRDIGNSKARLSAYAGENNNDDDLTSNICRIIWIQLLKIDRRVHRSRFRRSVLNAIPQSSDIERNSTQIELLVPNQLRTCKSSEKDWHWARKPDKLMNTAPVQQSQESQPLSLIIKQEQLSTAILLVFGVVGICMECGDNNYFPIERPDKDVRYLEREVDFYCKEIHRWTAGKVECEVLAAQAFYTLGFVLLEKRSFEFPITFSSLNDRLDSSVRQLRANFPMPSSLSESHGATAWNMRNRQQLLRRAAMSPLFCMRDLMLKMIELPSSGLKAGPTFEIAVCKSLEHVFGTGMEACLYAATQGIIAVEELKIALEVFQIALPRAPDEPKQCFALLSSSHKICDDEFDEALAELDMDNMLEGRDARPVLAWTIHVCRSKVIELISTNLRVVVQQLVLKYPLTDASTFEELYAIDLLGLVIGTGKVQFLWNNYMSSTAKSRNLAPRVLSAVLKHSPVINRLRSVFFKESEADRELCIAWLLGTLDITTFHRNPVAFKLKDAPFTVNGRMTQEVKAHKLTRIHHSDYWVMLTDGLIFHVLQSDSIEFETMDLNLLNVLRKVALTCKFRSLFGATRAGLHDAATLYDLHLDVFQSFCRIAGDLWNSYTATSSSRWHEMNLFRAKMVNPTTGIFVSFLDGYKYNFRQSCREIDRWNYNWHKLAKSFLRQAGGIAVKGRSIHDIDDSIKSFDERLTGLTTMFQFMYECINTFLFYCGEMAIGETNLFFSLIELLFRQMNSAEYPQAIKRLEMQRRQNHRDGAKNINSELRNGFCSASMRFVDSVQLFFACQKYPSLLHWFAQTSEIYQTFKTGWLSSPLRTLLVNMLDPDGPLGIHSYYPDDDVTQNTGLGIDETTIRREAFYLSCGLFNCKRTKSFEHSRAELVYTSCKRIQQLRVFVLNDYVRETLLFVLQQRDVMVLLETVVPLSQFVRATLHHANLNAETPNATQVKLLAENGVVNFDFQLSEIHPCLEWIVECMIKLIPEEKAIRSTICCVLLVELCGIVCEAITFHDRRPMVELVSLVELALTYLQTVYLALSKRTTAKMDTLFVANIESPSSMLRAHRFCPSAFRSIKIDDQLDHLVIQQTDTYNISLARATTDLLAAIVCVAQHCKTSSYERLKNAFIVS